MQKQQQLNIILNYYEKNFPMVNTGIINQMKTIIAREDMGTVRMISVLMLTVGQITHVLHTVRSERERIHAIVLMEQFNAWVLQRNCFMICTVFL